jgi:carbamoyltransferase
MGRYTIAPLQLEAQFGPARDKGEPLEARHFDIASSVQTVLEETVLQLIGWLHEKTGVENLCLAGGVALNCVMNARLRDQGPFKKIWVQPAAGDAGTALGAALWIDSQMRKTNERAYVMEHVYLGPAFTDADIAAFLIWSKLPFKRLENVAEEVGDYLAEGNVIGWFQIGAEFGPRALGARSLLAAPFPAEMQGRLNDLKDREDFRPVAPVVLEEHADAFFVDAQKSPFMLFINDIRPEKADLIPAVRHIDGTARIQTVNRQQNALYYDLINAFYEKTGVPVLINTSFIPGANPSFVPRAMPSNPSGPLRSMRW